MVLKQAEGDGVGRRHLTQVERSQPYHAVPKALIGERTLFTVLRHFGYIPGTRGVEKLIEWVRQSLCTIHRCWPMLEWRAAAIAREEATSAGRAWPDFQS